MELPVAVETNRLQVRPAVETDRARFVELFTDPDFMVFGARALDLLDEAQARFERFIELAKLIPYAKQPVVEKLTGRIIGYTDVDTAVIDGVDRLEWGWRIASEARGKGYATEAASALLDIAHDHHDGEMLCIIAADNVPSHRVARKLGSSSNARSYGRPTKCSLTFSPCRSGTAESPCSLRFETVR